MKEKISRNSPCPCLSGKKFKRCHGPIIEGAHRMQIQALMAGKERTNRTVYVTKPKEA